MTKKEMAVKIFEAMSTKNFELVNGFFNTDVVLNFPGIAEIKSDKKVAVFLKALLRKYKYLEFSIKDVIQENDKIVVVWTNKGEKIDNQHYENSGMTLFYFCDNKISFISDYFKDTSFIN